jgi:hypothetical protein
VTTEELARASLEALSLLSHVASVQPWEELRRVEGDEVLKQSIERAVRTWLDVLQRVRHGSNPQAVPRPADAESALQHMRVLLPSLAMDDVQAVAALRTYARQSLDALGFPLRESAD